jgi:hypothetical protein
MSSFEALSFPHALSGNEVFTLFHGSPDAFLTYEVPTREYPSRQWLPARYPAPYCLPETRELRWIDPASPYMAFIPRNDPFRGTLFHRLHFFDRPHLVRVERGWQLRQDIIEDWTSLETCCRRAVMGMMDMALNLFLLDRFQLHPLPERYQYRCSFATQRGADVSARRSQMAFLPLMGALSFMVLAFRHLEVNGLLDFDWRSKLAETARIHTAWIGCLEDSLLFNFNEPRVGGIIFVNDWRFTGILPLFQCVNMPIILCWGRIETTPTATSYFHDLALIPNDQQIQHLHTHAAQQDMASIIDGLVYRARQSNSVYTPSSTSHIVLCSSGRRSPSPPPLPPPVPGPVDPPQTFPQVRRYSGQRQGEYMEAFFQRRAQQNQLALQRETPQDQQRRQARERHARGGGAPGRRGATAFIWELIDGHRIRTAAGRNNYEHYWEMYGTNQRRYDPFNDEWDLCSEFGPPDDDDDDEDEDDDGGYHGEDNIDPLPIYEPPPPAIDAYSTVDDLHCDINILNDPPPFEVNPAIPYDTLDIAAYLRFGFQHDHPSAAGSKTVAWNFVRQLLGDGRWTLMLEDDVPMMDQGLMCQFFGYLSTSTKIADIPPPFYDLRQLTSDVNCLPHNTKIHVCRGNPTHYIFVPTEVTDTQFFVAIKSAAMAVEVIRRVWDLDHMSLIEALLARCIPFRLCVPGPHRNNQMPTSWPEVSSLGIRSPDSQFDEVDFQVYEALRNEFFRSERGHLALLEGGLAARLAHEVIPHTKAYNGPASDVGTAGLFIKGAPGYYSDVLSEAELNLIFGVYYVETGKFRS